MRNIWLKYFEIGRGAQKDMFLSTYTKIFLCTAALATIFVQCNIKTLEHHYQ